MSIGSVGKYAGSAGGQSQNFGVDVGHTKHTPKPKAMRRFVAKARKAKKVTKKKTTHHRTSRRRR